MSEKSTVYIVDIKSRNNNGQCQGHYLSVANNLKQVLSEKHKTIVAGGPVYRTKFIDIFELPYDTRENKIEIFNAIKSFINGVRIIKIAKNDSIVFQCCSVTVLLLVLSLTRSNSNIYLIQYDRMIIESKLKRILFLMAKRKISGIICPNQQIGNLLDVPFCVVPDYIYFPKNMPEKKTATYDFGFFGILAAGKGIEEAVRILAKTDYKVKIAGTCGKLPEDKRMMESLRNYSLEHSNIELHEGYQTEDEYFHNIDSVKFVVLNYTDSYELRSSGVILDAIYNRKPVLATKRKLTQFIEDYSLGVVYDNFEDLNLEAVVTDYSYEEYIHNIDIFLKVQEKFSIAINNFIV